MEENQRIECNNCAERNNINDLECKHCHNKLNKNENVKCPRCGILISDEKDYCKLCSISNAKGGAAGCTYGMSILLFVIGIFYLFFNYKTGFTLLLIAIFLYVFVFILVKIKYNRILKNYSIKQKVLL